MFTITSSINVTNINKRFKKFGKKMRKQRNEDVGRIREKLTDIARDEERRAKDIFKQHQEFFQDVSKNSSKNKTDEVAIDFFEN
jgi:hypothetical protein